MIEEQGRFCKDNDTTIAVEYNDYIVPKGGVGSKAHTVARDSQIVEELALISKFNGFVSSESANVEASLGVGDDNQIVPFRHQLAECGKENIPDSQAFEPPSNQKLTPTIPHDCP
ncbi:hypothetical protein LIER_34016 [Lithospermum erythrorhizon]|uniref:Uncharacterized protein n=1 Tax=Lithospermum erythrorhizon TaxID=34254 RepID=A0AAV3S061_LITER